MKNLPNTDSLKSVYHFAKPGLTSGSCKPLWMKQNLELKSCEVSQKYI